MALLPKNRRVCATTCLRMKVDRIPCKCYPFGGHEASVLKALGEAGYQVVPLNPATNKES